MSLADFQVGSFLGKGSFGTVYKVIRKRDGKEYALKELKIKSMSQQERYCIGLITPNAYLSHLHPECDLILIPFRYREEAVNEVRILASIKHPAIIHYCESFFEREKLYIVSTLDLSLCLN